MAKMEGLAHIGVFVSDLQKSKKFYEDILDFKTIWECRVKEADGTTTDVAFVQNGCLTLELVRLENLQKRTDGIVDHIAMKVEDIEAVKETLISRGIAFETNEVVFNADVFPNGSKWILFRGPDYEHLELTEVL
ncbi:VOC family protein [Christensenella intestinihominis]|uniref:VOC family protein n=1 Tax=Christensenella intestinihominis TaxID=1851429 RepID=UPI00082B7788|nr:VOC family protein [Christensenella intestinihominis]